MPFKSISQKKWMYSNHPEMAKQWQADTPNDASLPERASNPSKSSKSRTRRTSDRDYDRGMLHSSDVHKSKI